MMKEEAATMENSIYGSTRNSSSSDTLMYSDLLGGGGGGYMNQCSMFDNYMVNNGIEGELGFLGMLGVQEFQLPMGFRFEGMLEREMLLPSTKSEYHLHSHHGAGELGDGSRNAPGTPNSSSISSASNNEGVVVESEHEKAEEEEEEEDEVEGEEEKDREGSGKCKKLLKAKKANLKKQRQPRFAFMTKSEVDHLEDGYRWRKYGQKAVKNSPFPRSYYRCTTASCGVKKRVERSCTDSSIVVTTYEGQHTHPSPLITPRGLSEVIFQDSRSAFAATIPTVLMQMNNNHLHSRFQQQQQQQLPSSYFASHFHPNSYPPTNTALTTLLSHPAPNFNSFTSSSIYNVNVSNPNQGLIRDHGLLQDLIPSLLVPKEEFNASLI